MRLINATTLKLEDFPSNRIPQYTILSHTWGDDKDEVTFHDFSDPKQEFMEKPGFRKIKYCADQTSKDGLQYCWIDTCCIDKSSSAELSEAINSMFAWYRRSEICYIFLNDVDKQTSYHKFFQLQQSRWFRRGWTLQELIAPTYRQFFDCNWICLGAIASHSRHHPGRVSGFLVWSESKSITLAPKGKIEHLDSIVSQITGINESILHGQDLSAVSLATKFSWASHRKTTRVEDIAYCLLGIFDVNMPLLYGEGEKAFIRLQEEIIKQSADESIFAWCDRGAPPLSTFNGLLAPSPRYFSWMRGNHVDVHLRQDDGSSFEMTNNGLRIRLPLAKVPDKPSEYMAFLNVEGNRQYGLTLRKLTSAQGLDSHSLYARVDLHNVYASHPLVAYHNASSQWIWVRQSCDRIRSIPLYDKVSKIAFSAEAANNDTRIFWKEIIPRQRFYSQFHSQELALSVEPGRGFEVYIILILLGSEKTDQNLFFGWLIKANGKEEISSSFANLHHGTRAELLSGNLNWTPSIELAHHRIKTGFSFAIMHGELVAKLKVLDVVK